MSIVLGISLLFLVLAIIDSLTDSKIYFLGWKLSYRARIKRFQHSMK
jgi:hypothetical protein